MNDDPRFIEEIKNADMTEEMVKDVFTISKEAIQKYVIEQDIATFIKSKFDEKYDPNWLTFFVEFIKGTALLESPLAHASIMTPSIISTTILVKLAFFYLNLAEKQRNKVYDNFL